MTSFLLYYVSGNSERMIFNKNIIPNNDQTPFLIPGHEEKYSVVLGCCGQVQVAVEMWRYNPRKLSTRNVVDELSLALALREDADERVEEAVEEMLNELWRKIAGYRN